VVQVSQVRTRSFAPLWRGLDFGPAVVVLAPGSRQPAELPVAWRPLEERFQIAWCAVPEDVESVDRVEDVLETLADRTIRTHVVAHTALTDVATRLVGEFPHIVRGLVLVGSSRTPQPTGGRTRVVAPGSDPDLTRPDVVRDVLAAVDAGEAGNVRLDLPNYDRMTLGRLRVEFGRP